MPPVEPSRKKLKYAPKKLVTIPIITLIIINLGKLSVKRSDNSIDSCKENLIELEII
jgi:hypothetical protein